MFLVTAWQMQGIVAGPVGQNPPEIRRIEGELCPEPAHGPSIQGVHGDGQEGFPSAEALEGHVHDVPDWRDLLAESHVLSAEDLAALDRMAFRAARACGGGKWSVDFALDRAGKFWLIDMAVAEDSYHWPGCQNGREPDHA